MQIREDEIDAPPPRATIGALALALSVSPRRGVVDGSFDGGGGAAGAGAEVDEGVGGEGGAEGGLEGLGYEVGGGGGLDEGGVEVPEVG